MYFDACRHVTVVIATPVARVNRPRSRRSVSGLRRRRQWPRPVSRATGSRLPAPARPRTRTGRPPPRRSCPRYDIPAGSR